MKHVFARSFSLLVMFSLLGGCEDELSQGSGEPDEVVFEPSDDASGGEEALDMARPLDMRSGPDAAMADGLGDAVDMSDNDDGGEEECLFTEEQEATLETPGEWSDVERFTIQPGQEFDDARFDVSLCPVAASATSLVVVRIEERVGLVRVCSEEPHNPYGSSYTHHKVERLLHVAGERMPLAFDLKSFGGPTFVEEGEAYIVGVRAIDNDLFSTGYAHGVIEYDPLRERRDVKFSGKREALISMGEAMLDDFYGQCEWSNHFATDEEFRARYLTLDEGRCP